MVESLLQGLASGALGYGIFFGALALYAFQKVVDLLLKALEKKREDSAHERKKQDKVEAQLEEARKEATKRLEMDIQECNTDLERARQRISELEGLLHWYQQNTHPPSKLT